MARMDGEKKCRFGIGEVRKRGKKVHDSYESHRREVHEVRNCFTSCLQQTKRGVQQEVVVFSCTYQVQAYAVEKQQQVPRLQVSQSASPTLPRTIMTDIRVNTQIVSKSTQNAFRMSLKAATHAGMWSITRKWSIVVTTTSDMVQGRVKSPVIKMFGSGQMPSVDRYVVTVAGYVCYHDVTC